MKNKIFTLIISCFLIYGCQKEDKPNTTSNNTQSNTDIVVVDPNEISFTGILQNYGLVMPSNWTQKVVSEEIILNANGGKSFTISILPSFNNTDDIQTAVKSKFLTVFSGWSYSPTDYLSIQYKEQGKTFQGYDYYLERHELAKDDGNGDLIKIFATFLIIKNGNYCVPIIHFNNDPSNVVQELSYLLFSFRVKNQPNGNITISKDIVGPWSLVGSSVGAAITYFRDGNFVKGGASSYIVGHDAIYDKITTTSFSASGNFKLNGHNLEEYFKSNNQTYKSKIRFYTSTTGNDPWKSHLATINMDEGWVYDYPVEWDQD